MTTRTRDAERSREAILQAAEKLFAQRGYDGASLNDIAAAAGLSRGTPSYFFGSKEHLYVDVLDRAFAARQEATKAAFACVHRWCEGDEDLDGLRDALSQAAEDYLRFLAANPDFIRLVEQEELGGGEHLKGRRQPSTAMHDAFAALRRVGPRRGLRRFAIEDAILVFVGLTFTPMSLRNTLMRSLRRDLSRSGPRREQVALAVDQLMRLLSA